MNNSNIKVGFIGWNPFQLLHVKKIIEQLPGSCFILEKRGSYINEFDDSLLTDPKIPVLVWPRLNIDQLDGIFDIIVCQTPFSKIENFRKTRIAMIQYGYAKEAHNYGAWRSFSDLTLAYGDYAAKKLSHYSPSIPLGNSRYDDWFSEDFHKSNSVNHFKGLDKSRKTVLYAPTWGDLSSVDKFYSHVIALSESYNVLLKMHHNTALLEGARAKKLISSRVRSFGANVDLMELISVSDLIISDYSGAIFDALFAEKPIVLLDLDLSGVMGKKIDANSLEYEQRDSIGIRVSDPDKLQQSVDDALINAHTYIKKAEPLRKELFNTCPGATQRAVSALRELACGVYKPTQVQLYTRKEIIELYQVKEKLKVFEKKATAVKPVAKKPAGK